MRTLQRNRSSKGQSSIEFNIVIAFVAILFLGLLMIFFQKNSEAENLKLSINAQGIATRIAEAVNVISRNGHGYSRDIMLPDYLYGYHEYDIFSGDGFVWLESDELVWASPIITSNATILNITKGENNCVANILGMVIINSTCFYVKARVVPST